MAAAIGLDIGSSAVRAVQLSRSKSGFSLERLGQVLLPPGAVVDGTIEDAAAVVESLQILVSRFGFKGRKVALGLANQQVIVRRVDLPLLPPEGFKDNLRLQAVDHLPVPLDQVQFDYEFVEEFSNDDGTRMMRVLLVAADTAMVTKTLETVKAAKLKPVLLDLDAFAQVRSLRDPGASAERFGPGAGGGEMIVNIGSHLTNITVHAAGIPRFVRTISRGGEGITDSLSAAFDLPWAQAETVKSVLPGPASPYGPLLNERIAGLIDEIRNSVDYYRTEPGGVSIQRVVLTGGSSLIPDLDARLANTLSIDVEHGRPFRTAHIGALTLPPSDIEAAQPFFAVAMGLAMEILR
ncbi:MAG TPA: type IV pilus assembly protein PilM [Euzebya sp.]|nr:type IV pilus assembly protein PilM [Euzebya sp.]